MAVAIRFQYTFFGVRDGAVRSGMPHHFRETGPVRGLLLVLNVLRLVSRVSCFVKVRGFPLVLNVLQLIPTLDRSGAEKQMVLLARGLPHARFRVEVAVLTRLGPLAVDLEAAGL